MPAATSLRALRICGSRDGFKQPGHSSYGVWFLPHHFIYNVLEDILRLDGFGVLAELDEDGPRALIIGLAVRQLVSGDGECEKG